MSKRLIVTADDFGRAVPVNEAVEQAHRQGILTAASLMVAGDAAEDAVERARRLPGLAVGLHLTLVDGAPMLPAAEVGDLIEADGRFTHRLVSLGTRIYFNDRTRRQVAAEMRAQFERFRQTGLPLAHVDSHHHYHLHPTVFDLLVPLAVEYGAAGIRIPWEPPLVSWRARGNRPLPRLANGLFHWHRTRRMRRLARAAGLATNHYVFGVNESGAMTAEVVRDFLAGLPDGLSELYCHPATRRWPDHPLPEHYQAEGEFAALTDPAIIAQLRRAGIVLTHFAAEAGHGTPAPHPLAGVA